MTPALPLALMALSLALSLPAMGETVPRRTEGPSTARWRNHP